ncbi:MAG: hypothetical protein AVO33_09770 [delta proteobacterium ML8_F1]|nr:MAG: hypothetical protein AVO33_09770 [delta proteobacterium ML8_F1]
MKKVVLVTGASRGIGKEIAIAFANEGHIVYGCSRNEFFNSRFTSIIMDVNDIQSVEVSLSNIFQAHKKIDIVINNAGYDLYGSFQATSDKEVREQMETNFFGTLNIVRATLPYMKKQQSGQIINISSIGGLMAVPYNSIYTASKFALEGFFESIRFELHKDNIKVVLIEPQGVKTESLDISIKRASNELDDHKCQVEKMVNRMKKDGLEKGVTKAKVANKILAVSKKKNPKFRYPIGTFVSFVPLMKLLTPQKVLFKYINKQFVIER